MIFNLILAVSCRAVVRLLGVEETAEGPVANVSASNVSNNSCFYLMSNENIDDRNRWVIRKKYPIPSDYTLNEAGETQFKLLLTDEVKNSNFAIRMDSDGTDYYSRPWMCQDSKWVPSRADMEENQLNRTSANPSTDRAASTTGSKTTKKTTKKQTKSFASGIFGSAALTIGIASIIIAFIL